MKLWIDAAPAAHATPLFGIPTIERIRRSLGKLEAGIEVVLSGADGVIPPWAGASNEPDTAPLGTRLRRALAAGPLLALDGGNAVDPRLIRFLLRRNAPCVAARGEAAQRAVALVLEPALADAIPPQAPDLRAVADALLAAGRIAPLDEAEFPAYVDKLRRSLPYWIHAVDGAPARRRLERQMFWDNYKGSTDLLTRWVYPPLVWPLVRLCTRWRIHPNTVTLLAIALTILAVPLFARGDFLAGFLCAYGMSVLDSVDGKIARLTLTDSAIGNVLDHGTDIVHPPFWYFAWAWGLGGRTPADPLYLAAVWLIVFYLADRIVLGVARRRLGFALHAATPLDGRVRSFIARRNITMTIMAFAILLGAGPAGLYIVTAWQGLTFAWHAVRTLWLGFLAGAKARPTA
ncbi:CDP-alcohol phosphatidyltransferase family protein [Ramlibacter alkalitolerans]|uniref:CDP-alcohol phosphatidyltransferase family protein n=1 Tax=Ramlibacter alkalitolerans TaxID=2039631 RepID=A0ABS1JYW2_9BURK|nr:CDP-alcohol phosphatidyltransferase family protein [Ramlibacter alkalitolerans]MBL0428505.1 CDP-alcohol phosphatidyltransferase family protein [Ramlibacter alkalitolerans]